MTDQARCPHEATEPVEVRDHVTGTTTLVARICRACLAELPPAWQCVRCSWDVIEIRALCDPAPILHHELVRPCQEHA